MPRRRGWLACGSSPPAPRASTTSAPVVRGCGGPGGVGGVAGDAYSAGGGLEARGGGGAARSAAFRIPAAGVAYVSAVAPTAMAFTAMGGCVAASAPPAA